MCTACSFNALAFNDPGTGTTGGFAADAPEYGGNGANFVTSVSATGNQNINGLLIGSRWAGGTLTFSFPSLASHYEAGYTEANAAGFSGVTEAVKVATRTAMNLVSQYTNLVTSEVAPDSAADIRSAFSSSANPTAYAYYPSNSTQGGDVWYGTDYAVYRNPIKGQYAYHTVIHELGHALGLKHGHQFGGVANQAMTGSFDQMAYSVMTYRSYAFDPLAGGYSNEQNGYAQTYMMYDIAALQTMYGANYNTYSGNTLYQWNPNTGEMVIDGVAQGAPGGNRNFLTIWDGNGIDTYDFSNYTSNLSVNLTPGASSTLSSTQIANLGDGNFAPGNVFNALLFNDDARSMIENANGGSGNDTIIGNQANNVLNGNAGNDTFEGRGGSDIVDGGSGADILRMSGTLSSYAMVYYNGYTAVVGKNGEGVVMATNVETFRFSNTDHNGSGLTTFRPLDYLASNGDVLSLFGINAESGWFHYSNFGAREGRAVDLFNNYQYTASFDDLILAFGANQDASVTHYLNFGIHDGRAGRLVDFREYAATYGDILTKFGANNSEAYAQHFITDGFREGRTRDGFDNLRYIASHNDLITAYGANAGAALTHYVSNGFWEGRSKTTFDPLKYIASYNDIINTFGLNTTVATQHYIVNGFAEGRNRGTFDGLQYIASHGDLIRAFGTNITTGTQHFITDGFREGRTRDNFDAATYLSKYADLQAAYGTDQNAATRHYILFGFDEGRTDRIA